MTIDRIHRLDEPAIDERDRYLRGMEHLVQVVQELSLARTLEQVQRIVRTAARSLTGADGATFVLRDGDRCFYADEDAIAPLWKGLRFPMSSCISGWAMLHREAAVIEDIYADDRIPHDAYRPTFVKSLAMVPIRTLDPVGAIGNYWARHHRPTDTEVRLLRALADTTAVAMENVAVYTELEDRVRARTAELAAANQSLREFVAVAAHDIRSPLTAIIGASQILKPAEEAQEKMLDIIRRQSRHLVRLTDDLSTLSLYDSGHLDVRAATIDVRAVASAAIEQSSIPVELDIPDDLAATADPSHAQRIIANFLHNAAKYGAPPVTIRARAVDGGVEIRVCDEGPGVPEGFREKLFHRFSRAESAGGTEGSGIGLSIASALADANGGAISYEENRPTGSCFCVYLPA